MWQLAQKRATTRLAAPARAQACSVLLSSAPWLLQPQCSHVLACRDTESMAPGLRSDLFWQRCFPEPGWACLPHCRSSPPPQSMCCSEGGLAQWIPNLGSVDVKCIPWGEQPRGSHPAAPPAHPMGWADASSPPQLGTAESRQHQLVAGGTGCLPFSSLVPL